jgi:hypothetical protein
MFTFGIKTTFLKLPTFTSNDCRCKDLHLLPLKFNLIAHIGSTILLWNSHTSFLQSHNYLLNLCGLLIVGYKILMVSYENAHELQEVVSLSFIDFDENLGRRMGV